MIHEDTPETLREEAFQAPAPTWQTATLQPFTIARKAYFLSWRTAMGATPMAQLFDVDSHAFLEDAIRLVFLATLTAEELQPLRASFPTMQATCDEWANENILTPEQEGDIILLGLRLWNRTTINQHATAPDPDLAHSLGKSPCLVRRPSTSAPSLPPPAGVSTSSAGSYPSKEAGPTTTPPASWPEKNASGPRPSKKNTSGSTKSNNATRKNSE